MVLVVAVWLKLCWWCRGRCDDPHLSECWDVLVMKCRLVNTEDEVMVLWLVVRDVLLAWFL